MTDSPQASRLATPSWLDVRLVIGVLLVLVSVVVGARVLASADESQTVWGMTRDLAPGATVAAGDLERVRVRLFDRVEGYVPAGSDDPPTGYVLTRGLGAGELLPRAALREPDQAPELRDVSVPVDPGHLPTDLAAGQLVDVYVTVDDDEAAGARGARPAAAATPSAAPATPAAPATASPGPGSSATSLVLREIPVKQRGGDDRGTDAEAVVLSVSARDAERLVGALRQGTVDLVRVPRGSDLGRLPVSGP